MQTILKSWPAMVLIAIFTSCVCNTSGKLDTVGKTRHALVVEHPNTSMQPAPGLRTLHPSAFAHGS